MLLICERFAKEYETVFNTRVKKRILFPDHGNTIIQFVGGAIEHVANHCHLGCIIGAK